MTPTIFSMRSSTARFAVPSSDRHCPCRIPSVRNSESPERYGTSLSLFYTATAVGNLWALNYNARKNLVFDGGFNRGLDNTSTRWEAFAGFTYLLPHKVSIR